MSVVSSHPPRQLLSMQDFSRRRKRIHLGRRQRCRNKERRQTVGTSHGWEPGPRSQDPRLPLQACILTCDSSSEILTSHIDTFNNYFEKSCLILWASKITLEKSINYRLLRHKLRAVSGSTSTCREFLCRWCWTTGPGKQGWRHFNLSAGLCLGSILQLHTVTTAVMVSGDDLYKEEAELGQGLRAPRHCDPTL